MNARVPLALASIALSACTSSAHAPEGDPFVRVEMAIDWHERRRLLRVEHDLDVAASEVVYGAPHGVVRRSTRFETPAERVISAFASDSRLRTRSL